VQGKILLQGENLLDKSENEMRQIRGSRISMILQDPQTSLNPLFTIGNQLIEGDQDPPREPCPGPGAASHQRLEAGPGSGPGAAR
jgi:ABC-type dipeptide/oligopeptide/nickel transport system ATPase subunit